MLMMAAALTCYGQDTTSTTSSSDKTDTSQVTAAQSTPTYVFPDKDERFKRYLKSTVGPLRLGSSAASAGIEQWQDSPEEWGQGAQGFGKRYTSSLGSNAIQQTVTYGLDTALHLDTGFQKSNRDGFFPRFKDALLQNVTSRTTTGKRVISVPKFAGAYAGGIIPRVTWYPDRYSYKDGIRSGTKSLLEGFGVNLVREFVFDF
jgi:hypothetical protein